MTSYEIGWKAGLARWPPAHADRRLLQRLRELPGDRRLSATSRRSASNSTIPTRPKIYGFEAQVEAVFGQFSLDAGVGWMQSELGEFYAVDPRVPSFGACDPETGPASASCINLEGQDQTYAPDFTFNLGAQYDFAFDRRRHADAANQLRARLGAMGDAVPERGARRPRRRPQHRERAARLDARRASSRRSTART